jgi:hypothetical protein
MAPMPFRHPLPPSVRKGARAGHVHLISFPAAYFPHSGRRLVPFCLAPVHSRPTQPRATKRALALWLSAHPSPGPSMPTVQRRHTRKTIQIQVECARLSSSCTVQSSMHPQPTLHMAQRTVFHRSIMFDERNGTLGDIIQ